MNKKLYNKRYEHTSTLQDTQEFKPVAKPEPKPEPVIEPTPVQEDPIRKGSRVKFTGNKTYSGIPLDISKTDVFTVIELSGDRAVIGKGSQIIAAVNTKNCKKVK